MSGNCPFKRAWLTPAKLHHTGQIHQIPSRNAPPPALRWCRSFNIYREWLFGEPIPCTRSRKRLILRICKHRLLFSPANFSVGVTSRVFGVEDSDVRRSDGVFFSGGDGKNLSGAHISHGAGADIEPSTLGLTIQLRSRTPPCWILSETQLCLRRYKQQSGLTRQARDAYLCRGGDSKYLQEVVGSCRCQFSLQWVVFSWCMQTGRRIPPSWAQKQGTPEGEWTHLAEVESSLHLRYGCSWNVFFAGRPRVRCARYEFLPISSCPLIELKDELSSWGREGDSRGLCTSA